jgi:hypothetical protein
MTNAQRIVACLIAGTLCACSTGAASTTPPITSSTASPSNSKLMFAVGTVNFAGVGMGINVLETFRGTNGYSAVPINTATLSGPAGFSGPAGSLDPGAGAPVVPLGSILNSFIIGNAGNGTILASADGFGMGPPSSATSGLNFYPAQPQFADATPGGQAFFPAPPTAPGQQPRPSGALPIYGGQPAYPAAPLVSSALDSQLLIPSGWPEGFYVVALDATPPSGTYTLNVGYTQNSVASSTTATATLNNATVLPPFGIVVTSTGNGGATVTLPFLPPGITEVVANVIDTNVPPATGATCYAGAGVATVVFKATGTQTIPSNLGQGGSPTFCSGDFLAAYGYGFDYDDVGLGPPSNTKQAPALPAQADVSITATSATE